MTDYTIEIQPDLIQKLARTEPVKAVSELVWNGFDANADSINIEIEYDDLGGMSKVVVVDDGIGIPYAEAPLLFKRLGGSWKKRGAKTDSGRALHGYEGRGRYKAFSLGRVVKWNVIYEREASELSAYSITILEADNQKFSISEEESVSSVGTGVRVEISELDRYFKVFEEAPARQHLAEIFALYLKNYRDVRLYLQGDRIDPSEAIREIKSYDMPDVVDADDMAHPVSLEIIDWKIETEKALYLCDEDGFPLTRVLEKRFHTGDFRFSAYLKSGYIADLYETGQLELAEMVPTMSEAIEEAQQQIRSHFLRKAAESAQTVVESWKEEKVYPYEGDAANPVEKVERQVFDIVATTANDFMPEFNRTPVQQKAMHLRMIRSALERSPDELQRIIGEVLQLPQRKQKELANLLEDVSLTGIINAAKTVSDRLKILDGLEAILFDLDTKKILKERTQLHRIVAQETWLFGEEFHLTADDEGLTKVLRKHAKRMSLNVAIDKPVTRVDGKTGIIDLMLSKKSPSFKPNDSDHLVVELKAPKVKVGADEMKQIKSYAFAVAEDERFREVGTRWNFWVISNEMDRFAQLEARQENRPSGVIFRHAELDLTIWAKTWAQVLDENRTRLKFFQENLEQKASHENGLKHLAKRYRSLLEGVIEVSNEKEFDRDSES